ncbi:uncharacterized protein BX663DRAFT_487267 [Cokeromyces recurvatus]|uniref:uncharacterized protein n=1 Tax=Cokeromyces recurvatus TaxID=90255 RepID=UPI002221075B|nr:uncharacterized protein BX663DRAFT_487267 [Cokeromyces recurvatus]KAI7902003.1 hypothetical protein BX663DRAFT_487267 [Cokeromyces recurvatus]
MVLSKSFDCYKVLNLNKETATESDIKKAYRKLALQFHPDKLPQDATQKQKEQANATFQQLSMAYAVLSDAKRKSRYDKTGSMEESEFDEDKDWAAYFKELWTGVVNADTIEEQKKKYQGSDEEKKDLLKAYESCKGNMDQILELVECSTARDCKRFEKIIRSAIKEKLVTFYPALDSTTTPRAHKKRIEKELMAERQFLAEQEKDKDNKSDKECSLLELIQQRNKDRQAKMDSIIETIEASAKKENKKRKDQEREDERLPTEEEFQRLQRKLFNNKKQKK